MFEFIIAMPVIILTLFWGVPKLWQSFDQRHMASQVATLSLAQADERARFALPDADTAYWHDALELSLHWRHWMILYARDEYPFANATRPFELLARYEQGLAMSNDNLWDVEVASFGSSLWIRYLRLRDDWSPQQVNDLRRRPALLTGTHLFDNHWVETLQQALSMLPMARELRANQLRFGYVDEDVVPADALCSVRGDACIQTQGIDK